MTYKANRRSVIISGMAAAAGLAAPAIARAGEETQAEQTAATPAAPVVRENISSFRTQDWHDYFKTLGKATIVADTESRALHFWSGDGKTYKVFPTSVPRTDELTKRGYTHIVRKQKNPAWYPTASQLKRYPDWKPIPPGPECPLGTRAMYLGWPHYIIHGTQDTRKIGRRSSDGCIGMYNFAVEELYPLCPIGTQVLIL